ncbi:hypothetical protein BDV41DRAFT_519400, partial [Aspergillus transmontanensis]
MHVCCFFPCGSFIFGVIFYIFHSRFVYKVERIHVQRSISIYTQTNPLAQSHSYHKSARRRDFGHI